MADEGDLPVGTPVLVNSKHRAIVKYVGSTNFAEGVWYGLELERDIGKHTGTVLGVSYFVSPPKRGTFVKRDNIIPYDPANPPPGAAPSRKSGSGGGGGSGSSSGARKSGSSREAMQRAFNALDADEEAQLFARRNALLQTALGQRLNRERPPLELLERHESEAGSMAIEPDYDGPHISLPPTQAQVIGMMDAFRAGKKLHYKYAAALVGWYKRYAGALPTLVQTAVAPGGRVTVCGDTHGQLEDLFTIFTINGHPTPENRYLMNGDYVDRGERAVEILLTLYAWCAVYPGEFGTGRGGVILLNRGNHESGNQNMTGGFMMEVLDKYSGPAGCDPEMGLRMYDLFQASFDAMPLAHLVTTTEGGPVGGSPTAAAAGAGAKPAAPSPTSSSAAAADKARRVFVTHGGLMQRPGIRLEHVASVKRKREIPYGLPGFEDKLFEDLMWSDPRVMEGHCPSDRGAGVFFGPDVTERFCALNGVSLVVRSHECVPEGFLFMHRDHLLTVFSASRYCGRGTNRGAFVVFEDDLSLTVQQYVAGSLATTAPGRARTGPVIDASAPQRTPAAAAEASALERDYALSTAVAHGALPAPVKADGSSGGSSHMVVRHVNPEHGAGPTAADDEDAALAAAQEEAVRAMLVERICLHKSELFFFWARTDDRGARDGTITRGQWADGMRTVLNLDLPWAAIAHVLGVGEQGEPLNYSRFLDRFRIEMRDSDAAWMDGIVGAVCVKMAAVFPSLETAFKSLDKDGSGELELEELERGLASLQLGLSRSQLVELMNAIDANKDGRVQFGEFQQRFRESFESFAAKSAGGKASAGSSPALGAISSPAPRLGSAAAAAAARRPSFFLQPQPVSDPWAREALSKLGAALVASGAGDTTVALFTRLDSDGDGVLTHAEFAASVSSRLGGGEKLASLGLSAADLSRLAGVIDANGSGAINYLEFTEAFAHVPAVHAPVDWRPTITDAAAAQLYTAVATSASAGLSKPPSGGAGADASGPAGAAWQRGIIEQIVSILYQFRVELAAAFRMFDTDGDGVISREEFQKGLAALTGLHGSPITQWQADEMLRALDTDGDGTINYEEFVGGFKLVDRSTGAVVKAGGGAPGSPRTPRSPKPSR